MKINLKLVGLLIAISFLHFTHAYSQVGITFPSLSTEQRDTINTETGQMIFNETTLSMNVFDGKKWVELSEQVQMKANGLPDKIEDGPGTTSIDCAQAQHHIRFKANGVERLVIKNHTIEPINNGSSVFLGGLAGNNDDLSFNKNVFVGAQAGFKNVSGNSNVCVGFRSGDRNVSGFGNVNIGSTSGLANITGNLNVNVGRGAGTQNTNGSDNVCLGGWSGHNNVGSRNVFLGYRAGFNETGSNKLYIENSTIATPLIYGDFATNKVGINGNLGIGSHNANDEILVTDNDNDGDAVIRMKANAGEVVVGFNYSNQALLGTESNHDLRMRTNGTTRMTLKNNGNVGIGTLAPSQKLHVQGNICATGNVSSCSDIRYKENFQKIDNALFKVSQLNGLYYHWKTNDFPEKEFTTDRQIGVIAQEVEALFPEMVLTDTKGYKSVDYARLTPVLIEALKELKNEVSNQQIEFSKQLNSLESKIEKIVNQ